MKLVIGGSWQGKREAAVNRYGCDTATLIDGGSCPLEEVYTAKGIYNFQEYIKRCMLEEKDISNLPEVLYKENPDMIIICNEVGAGLVPMDAFERNYREQVGRICSRLAAKAEEVLRVLCGIPTVIKHG